MRTRISKNCSRMSVLLLSFCIFLFAHGLAHAQSQNWRWCTQQERVSLDAQIGACTAIIQSGQETRTNTAVAFTNRGIAYAGKGQFDQAIADYNEAIKFDARFSQAFNFRGRAYEQKNNSAQAIADYTTAIRLDPKNQTAMANRGYALTDAGEFDRALSDFNSVIALNAKSINAYVGRSSVYQKKGELDKALDDAEMAHKIDPGNSIAVNQKASVWHSRKNYDRAIQDATESIRLSSTNSFAYAVRGSAKRLNGDIEGSIADLTEAIRLNPKEASAYTNRGNSRSDTGNYDLAISDYNMAIQLNPGLAQAFNGRGAAYGNKGDRVRAIADYTEAIRLNPRYALALYNRGQEKQAAGDRAGGAADIAAAIAINPRIREEVNELARLTRLKVQQSTKAAPSKRAPNTEPNLLIGLAGIALIIIAGAAIALASSQGRNLYVWIPIAIIFNLAALLFLWLSPPARSEATKNTATPPSENSSSRSKAQEASAASNQAQRSPANDEADYIWLVNNSSEPIANPSKTTAEEQNSKESKSGSSEAKPRVPYSALVKEQGEFNGRTYRIFGDGKVEYDSLLGKKAFGSIREFKEFVGIASGNTEGRWKAGIPNIVAGATLSVTGVLISAAGQSAAAARGGGTYLVFTGLILYGLYQIAIGLGKIGNQEEDMSFLQPAAAAELQPAPSFGVASVSGRTALGRHYWVLSDGRVEYDSPSGRRVFQTEAEFRDFIN